ncbi:MAG: hypothetical protein RLZZ271_1117, partial [Pseudomonadota bacterium]
MLALSFLALTILWAEIPKKEALGEWFRHSRMLFLLLVIYLLRSRAEVVWVLRWFVWMQLFVVLSSWMLWAGLPVPWALYRDARSTYGVFASYLEQSVMTVIALVMLGYFRKDVFPGLKLQWLAWALLLLGAINVLLILPSMTGYIALIAAAAFALARLVRASVQSSPKWIPILLLGVCAMGVLGYPKVAARVALIINEVNQVQGQAQEDTSSGKRINYWIRSVQSFKEAPLLGHGVG